MSKNTKQVEAPIEAVESKPIELMETPLGIATVETEAVRIEREAKEKEAARAKAIAEAPRFKLAGSEVNTYLLENAIKRVISDSGRIASEASKLNLGSEIKTITGSAVRVVNIKAARELASRGLLGDKTKTKQRLDDLIQMNSLIDACQHFGLLKRQVEK